MPSRSSRVHNIERFQSFYHQVSELEGAAYERIRKSAKDVGDMMSETVTYAADLIRELQKVGLEAVRRSARMSFPED